MRTRTHTHKQVKYPHEHSWFWIFLLSLIGPRWGINNHIWKFLYKWQESQWLGSQIFHALSLPETQDKCGLHLPPYKYTHSHLRDSLLWQILLHVKAELVSVSPIPPNVDWARKRNWMLRDTCSPGQAYHWDKDQEMAKTSLLTVEAKHRIKLHGWALLKAAAAPAFQTQTLHETTGEAVSGTPSFCLTHKLSLVFKSSPFKGKKPPVLP